jgi:hypothetical protein
LLVIDPVKYAYQLNVFESARAFAR